MKAKISFEINPPVDCTEEQFIDWLNFELNNGSIALSNPLHKYDLDNVENYDIEIVKDDKYGKI